MTFVLTTNHLTQILKGNKEIEAWHKAMVKILPRYKIDTAERVAAFLAQCGHESNNFTTLEENLNYSAKQLQKTWPKRFNAKLAAQVARQPQRIAEIAYGGRMGNTQPNDGWRFRGHGAIQLTGRTNFTNWGMTLNKSAEQAVDYIKSKDGAIEAACWYWKVNNLNKWVDAGDFDGLSDAINIGRKTSKIGDAHGFADRQKRYNHALTVLTGRAAAVAPVAPVAPVVTPTPAPEPVTTWVQPTSPALTSTRRRRSNPAVDM